MSAEIISLSMRSHFYSCTWQFGRGQGTQGVRGVVPDGLSALYRLVPSLALARSTAQPQTPSPPFFSSARLGVITSVPTSKIIQLYAPAREKL